MQWISVRFYEMGDIWNTIFHLNNTKFRLNEFYYEVYDIFASETCDNSRVSEKDFKTIYFILS